jgi:AcrR family transcriptional regulator
LQADKILTVKSKRTRQSLLDAAVQVAGEKGIAAVTVKEICDVAGVGRTSFYNYFDDVTALLTAVAIQASDRVKSAFDTLHEDAPRGLARLRACLCMILDLSVENRALALLLTSLARSGPDVIDRLKAEIENELAAIDLQEDLNVANAEQDNLATILALSTLALLRDLAEKRRDPETSKTLVDILLRGCHKP